MNFEWDHVKERANPLMDRFSRFGFQFVDQEFGSLDALSGENLGEFMKQPKLNNLRINNKKTLEVRNLIKKAEKTKITINIDQDLLGTIKAESKETGVPYQKLLNSILRDALSVREQSEKRLDRLEKEIEKLKKKLSA